MLTKTSVGSARAAYHQLSSPSMKANNCAVVTYDIAPSSLPTNLNTITVVQAKVVISYVISSIIRRSVNIEASVEGFYNDEYQ